MELRDYLRMLRRGWPTVLLLIAICLGGVLAYLKTTAKEFSTSSVIVVLPKDPKTFTDLNTGSQYTVDRATTYAQIIDSPQVLSLVAEQLRPRETVQQLENQVSAAAPTGTSIITISVTSGSAASAEMISNAVAHSAAAIIPTVAFGTDPTAALLTVDVLKTSPSTGVAISPSSKRILGIGVALGLVLGLVITVARQSLDTRLRLPSDVQDLELAPLRGVLPRLDRGQRGGITVRDDPSSFAGDSYRSLRTNLGDVAGRGRRSLVFSGVSDSEIAAQVALNLAWSFAQAGRRVLFMDLDMRRSPVDALLGDHSGPGMADVLVGHGRLQDVVEASTQPKLWVARSGVATSNPADLLSSAEMVRVLDDAKVLFETVVVHVPPLLSFTDGALVALAADQTFLVISAGRTRTAELTEAMDILRNIRNESVGLILYGVRGGLRRLPKRTRIGDLFNASEASEVSDGPGAEVPPASNMSEAPPASPPESANSAPASQAGRIMANRPMEASVATEPPVSPGPAGPPSISPISTWSSLWLSPAPGSTGDAAW